MFDHLCHDKVILIKKDGTIYENISASVQSGKIFISDGLLPIEEEDKLVRNLPNGLSETFNVIDRGYKKAGGIPAHYQVKVEKETKNKKQSKESIVCNFSGDISGNNSRINIGSNDYSSNVNIESINETNVFDKLRETIELELNDEEKKDVLLSIEELEQTKGNEKYEEAYESFIKKAKDWMEIITPFIPVLKNFLQSLG